MIGVVLGESVQHLSEGDAGPQRSIAGGGAHGLRQSFGREGFDRSLQSGVRPAQRGKGLGPRFFREFRDGGPIAALGQRRNATVEAARHLFDPRRRVKGDLPDAVGVEGTLRGLCRADIGEDLAKSRAVPCVAMKGAMKLVEVLPDRIHPEFSLVEIVCTEHPQV